MVVLNKKNNNHMGDPGCKSLNLVFQIETGSYGKRTEHLCYDCWPTNPTDRRPDRFWNALTSQSTWVYIGLSEPRSKNHTAMEFPRKCYLTTMREMSTDKCRTQRPWNYELNEGALQEALIFSATKHAEKYLEKLRSMSPCSLDVWWELRSDIFV